MRTVILFFVAMWMVAAAGLAQQQEPPASEASAQPAAAEKTCAQPAAVPYSSMMTVKDGRMEVMAELPLDPREAERLGVSPEQFATALGVLQQLGGLTIFDPTCPGTTERCVDTFCANLTGAQRAQCIVTCQKTPVCGDCKCSCNTTCQRSCTQRCCRTVEGPPFRQICCTRACIKLPDEIDPGP